MNEATQNVDLEALPQWSVEAENGERCFASQEVAEAVAGGESGYTMGLDRSRLVCAYVRSTPDAEWTLLGRPATTARHDRGCAAGVAPSAPCTCATTPAPTGPEEG